MNRDLGGAVARGASGGALATTAMSLVMVGAQKAGLMGKMPPEKITHRLLDRLRVPHSRPQRKALSVAAHFGYGLGCGVAFALLDQRLPEQIPGPVKGAAFGLLLWAGSYLGWVPAVRIMPTPARDRPGRPTAMILAHLVFGAVLGAVVERGRARAQG